MAVVHPSRMAFIPHDSRDRISDSRPSRRRSPSPRGRSPHSDRHRTPEPPRAERKDDAPWRQRENMYPSRRERDRPPHNDDYYGNGGGGYGYEGRGGGGADYMEARRLQREKATANVWPPSPKAPARGLSPAPRHSKSRKKSKRTRSETPSEDSYDSEEERRRERKEKKRARKEREREERKEKDRRRKHRSSSRRYSDSEDDERERGGARRRSERRSESKGKSRSPDRRRSEARSRTPASRARSEPEEEDWVEKPAAAAPFVSAPIALSNGSAHQTSAMSASTQAQQLDEDDSDDEVGPQPLQKINARKVDERAYGGALLRGEGSAMAAFLQDGTDVRIPRRGEIGLTSGEIASYESVGYVMSGSRHRRMNAVRMRKENQVISAEEKRGILKLQRDERERREAILREEFNELVSERLKAPQPSAR